jgi:hypothetical protein
MTRKLPTLKLGKVTNRSISLALLDTKSYIEVS